LSGEIMRQTAVRKNYVVRCAGAAQKGLLVRWKRVSEWYVRNIVAGDRFAHSAVGGNTAMKAAASLLVAGLVWAGAAQGQQSVTLQMQCRNLNGSGNYMAADETYVNGMACRPVPSANAAEPTTLAQAQPYAGAPSYAYASAPALADASVKGPVALGPSVYIEPMQGLEGYLSVAFERKHVPLAPVVSDAHATYVLHLYWGSEDAAGKTVKHVDGTPSLQLIERSSGTVVFAYPLNRANTWHGEKVTAETFASQVRDVVAKR
jgi:hypothetical protein